MPRSIGSSIRLCIVLKLCLSAWNLNWNWYPVVIFKSRNVVGLKYVTICIWITCAYFGIPRIGNTRLHILSNPPLSFEYLHLVGGNSSFSVYFKLSMILIKFRLSFVKLFVSIVLKRF